jgi:hypothetical protein
MGWAKGSPPLLVRASVHDLRSPRAALPIAGSPTALSLAFRMREWRVALLAPGCGERRAFGWRGAMNRPSNAVAAALPGAVALLGLFGGCTGNADTRREDDVFIAALQADIRLVLGDTPRSAAPTFCVAIDPGDAPQSPRKEFVARLKGSAPHVVRSAECEVRRNGVVDVPTGRPAVLLTAGPVEWVAMDEAEVDIITTLRAAQTMRRRYRVVHEAGRWVCLGQVMKISPA